MSEQTQTHTQAAVRGDDGKRAPRARVGQVASASRDKTIKVVVGYFARHPKYGKYVRRRIVLHAHDEDNAARVGDRVEVVPCRPLSKTKSWRLTRIMEHQPAD